MAFDFPSSPIAGQEFTPVTGITYVWNGYAWTLKPPAGGGGSSITISDTPPVSPTDGSMWWESDSGTLWISYNDGSSIQWIDVSGNSAITPGMVVGSAYAELTTYTSGNAAMAGGIDTIPQQTDGIQFLAVAITPKAATNRLRIHFAAPMAASVTTMFWVALFQDSTVAAIAAVSQHTAVDNMNSVVMDVEIAAGTTSATTFKLRYGWVTGGSGTIAINGNSAGRRFGGAQRAVLEVLEIKA